MSGPRGADVQLLAKNRCKFAINFTFDVEDTNEF